VCDEPPIYPVPGVSDVGLMLLERPAKDIKPALLAPPGTLETGRGDSQEMSFVSYGPPALGVRHYQLIPPEQIFDDR
jgi:hypothetical protein